MIVRVSFELKVPDNTWAGALENAARNAACEAENTIERATEQGARAGTARATIITNKPDKKDPR